MASNSLTFETIEVNKEKYYKASEVDSELTKVNKKKRKNPRVCDIKILQEGLVLDNSNVLGMGSFEITGDWIVAKFNIEYLERIIKIFKVMGVEHLSLAYTEDKPLIIGNFSEDGKMSGMILAPRVEDEK